MKYDNKTIKKNTNRKNCWYLRYYKNGIQKTVYGKTQKDVVKNYKLALKEKSKEITNNITLKEWFRKFKELYKNGEVKDTTIKAYDYDFKKLKVLYNIELKDLNAITIQETLTAIPYQSTKQRIYTFLNSLLEKAVVNNLIAKNPMKILNKPKYKAKEKTALTRQEEERFIQACKNHKYGNYYLICLYQGLRKGECRALKVNDIDFENMTLQIDESLNTHTERTTTKNLQSMRTIPLFKNAFEILKNLVKDKKQTDFIFDIGVNRVDIAIKQICKSAQIKSISTHILRHTFITRCQELNIPLFVVQAWVGHERGSVVTTKIYTHLNEETNAKYIDIFNKQQND